MITIETLVNDINAESKYREVSYDNSTKTLSIKSYGKEIESFKGEGESDFEFESGIMHFLYKYYQSMTFVNYIDDLIEPLSCFYNNTMGNNFRLTFNKRFNYLFKPEFSYLFVDYHYMENENENQVSFEHAGNIFHITFE
jgi:hypothetical protein